MSRTRATALALLGLFLLNVAWNAADAAEGASEFSRRAEQRAGTRWTLAEWLEQKDRNRLMDMWLAMNSSSPYEMMIGGSYLATERKVDAAAGESFTSYGGELRAYAHFVGLTVEHSNNTQEGLSDLAGLFNLRLLGDSLQNSSLTLHVGQLSRSFEASGAQVLQRNSFTQASLQLYMARSFGLDAFYRRYEPAEIPTGETVAGTLMEAGLFIDFKAVRVFGAWSQERQTSTSGSTETVTTRDGIRSGLRFYY